MGAAVVLQMGTAVAVQELPLDVLWDVQDLMDAQAPVNRGPQVTGGFEDEETDVDG